MIAHLSLCVLCFAVVISAEPFSIPLKRLHSPFKMLMAHSDQPRYKKIINHLESLKDSKHTIPLFKFLDYEFYGDVLIGHPGQRFKVVFDTSWRDLWIPSVLCPFINIACINRQKYDHTQSSTYKYTGKKFNVAVGKYNLTGMIASDLVQVGQINITGQTFGEVDGIPWKEFLFSKADGVFGLGFDIGVQDGITPFFFNMIKQKTVSNATFSFYFNRDLSSEKGGALLLGDTDPKHYRGNFTYLRVDSRSGFWEIAVDSVSVKLSNGSFPFCKGGCKAIIDTSTNDIKGPPNEINFINQLIKARRFYFNKFTVDCGKVPILPHVTITISNKVFVLKGPDYIQKVTYGPITICISSFTPYEGNTWTFGGAFMSRYYTVFDLENFLVGFATAR